MKASTQYLFLYGSLLPAVISARDQPLIAGLRLIGSGSVPGQLYDLGDYPGAVLDSAENFRIHGQVFERPPDLDVFSRLDVHESFRASEPDSSLYVRVQHHVDLADGRALPCWLYVYNRKVDAAPLIPDGDYVRWRTAQGQ